MERAKSSSVEEAHDAILETGFFIGQDPLIGQRIASFEADRTPFASAGGLQFCNTNVLNHPLVRPVLESFFEWFGLGLYRSFGAVPGDYTFRRSDPESEVESLLVQLWSEGSEVSFWRKSHRHRLLSVFGENFLWRVPRASLKGLERTDVLFQEGGFAVVDPRLALEVTKGTAITFAFGTKEVLCRSWQPMKFPKSKDIEEVVAMIEEGSNCGLNIAYIG